MARRHERSSGSGAALSSCGDKSPRRANRFGRRRDSPAAKSDRRSDGAAPPSDSFSSASLRRVAAQGEASLILNGFRGCNGMSKSRPSTRSNYGACDIPVCRPASQISPLPCHWQKLWRQPSMVNYMGFVALRFKKHFLQWQLKNQKFTSTGPANMSGCLRLCHSSFDALAPIATSQRGVPGTAFE
jgi:hypothetical protein